MAVVDVTIVPLGVGPSVSQYVAVAEKVLAGNPQIKHLIGPMSTTLEGDLAEILTVIQEMQEAVFNAGVQRVNTTIRIDERRDKKLSIDGKLNSLEERLKA